MKCELKDDTFTVYLEGRIDSNNAQERETELMDCCAAQSAANIVVDCNDLVYLSSAGLRIMLRLRKTYPSVRLVNVQSDVYDVFEMTGFTEMMPIEKAFRTLSVEGCTVIGQGANGKVYRIGDDTIVKVYRSPDSLDDIRRERELAKRAFILGIPTAISYEVVKVGNGYGSVFELLDAHSLAELLSNEPQNIDRYVQYSVDLLKKIHATDGDPAIMPDMKAVAENWASFDSAFLKPETGKKLMSLVQEVPYSTKLMHGDYHIKNVMMQSGEALLIDMDTLCIGHPIFELGSMFVTYIGFAVSDHDNIEQFLGIPFELGLEFWHKSLAMYLGTDDPATLQEVENKVSIVGYMRLLRRGVRRGWQEDPAKRHLLSRYIQELETLVPQTDTLLF